MNRALDTATLDAMIRDSPANAWLGLRTLSVDQGQLVLQLPWREQFRSASDEVDPGVLAFALNAACGYLVVALTGRGGAIADLRCDALACAPAGGDFTIVATLLKHGRSLSCTQAQIQDQQGRLLMLSRCSYFMAPA